MATKIIELLEDDSKLKAARIRAQFEENDSEETIDEEDQKEDYREKLTHSNNSVTEDEENFSNLQSSDKLSTMSSTSQEYSEQVNQNTSSSYTSKWRPRRSPLKKQSNEEGSVDMDSIFKEIIQPAIQKQQEIVVDDVFNHSETLSEPIRPLSLSHPQEKNIGNMLNRGNVEAPFAGSRHSHRRAFTLPPTLQPPIIYTRQYQFYNSK